MIREDKYLKLYKEREAIGRFVDKILGKFSSPGYWEKAPKKVHESDLEKYFDKSKEWEMINNEIFRKL